MSSRSPKSKRKANSHNLFVGVDGGGTKTQIVVINAQKEVVGEGFAGASNPLRVGLEPAVSNIFAAIDKTFDEAQKTRSDIVAIECGIAGVRRADLRHAIHERIIQRFRLKKVEVVTDAEIALYGATLGKIGLVVIAGTGSVCIGQDSKGKKISAGGWGPLAGDEGGGAGIARRALQAIAKASDGRGKPTKLSDAAVDYFRAGRLENLSVAIYGTQVDNARIAGFARFVVETAKSGDEVAIAVLDEAGRELGLAAKAVIHSLKLEKRKFPIGYVGSIFNAGDLILKSFIETVCPVAPRAFIAPPKLTPAHAAAIMAFERFANGKKN